MSTNEPTPDVRLDFFLEPYGFEMHLMKDGEYVGHSARDFGGFYNMEELKHAIIAALTKYMGSKFESRFKEILEQQPDVFPVSAALHNEKKGAE